MCHDSIITAFILDHKAFYSCHEYDFNDKPDSVHP